MKQLDEQQVVFDEVNSREIAFNEKNLGNKDVQILSCNECSQNQENPFDFCCISSLTSEVQMALCNRFNLGYVAYADELGNTPKVQHDIT
jgi:hypothetical protein